MPCCLLKPDRKRNQLRLILYHSLFHRFFPSGEQPEQEKFQRSREPKIHCKLCWDQPKPIRKWWLQPNCPFINQFCIIASFSLGTNSSEILFKIQNILFTKMHLKYRLRNGRQGENELVDLSLCKTWLRQSICTLYSCNIYMTVLFICP